MTKAMRELKRKMQALLTEIKGLDVEADGEKVAQLLDEMEALDKTYAIAERAYQAEKAVAGEHQGEEPPAGEGETKLSGFSVMAKLLRGQSLSEAEFGMVQVDDALTKALISGANAANGENYLIPEDVRTTINELRRRYMSAKDLVTVIPVSTLSGSFVFEKGSPSGLVGFTDGGDVSATGGEPEFETKGWSVSFFGKIIPVSNILTAAETSGLTAYLNKWFVKNSIKTENDNIFSELKAGKTAETIDGWDGLKTSINVDLDPDCKLGGIIATNQSGFNFLDSATDTTGRPILQPNPVNSTQKLFQDMPITVFPDAQLPNEGEKFPIFYGRLEDGCWFMEFQHLLFAASAHAGFGKNQTHMRVIEGFDVMGADKDAYMYGLMSEGPAPTE